MVLPRQLAGAVIELGVADLPVLRLLASLQLSQLFSRCHAALALGAQERRCHRRPHRQGDHDQQEDEERVQLRLEAGSLPAIEWFLS
jgi:hypothetical protein